MSSFIRAVCLALAVAPIAAAGEAAAGTTLPYDPSLHEYRETLSGGIQIVVAHEVSHAYVDRLRSSLRKTAGAYERGQYPEPKPGSHSQAVAALRGGSSRITVTYADVGGGGAITLRTSDPGLIHAIHDWFAAEVTAERAKNPHGGPGLSQ